MVLAVFDKTDRLVKSHHKRVNNFFKLMCKFALTIPFILIYLFSYDLFNIGDRQWINSVNATSHLTSKMACFADRSLCSDVKPPLTKNNTLNSYNPKISCQKTNTILREKIEKLEMELKRLKQNIN